MDRYKLYTNWLIILIVVEATLILLTCMYLQPVTGDTTRLSGYSENDFGWNLPQKTFAKAAASLKEGYDQYSDVVVVGDSFSFGGVLGMMNYPWQTFLTAATSLSVITISHYTTKTNPPSYDPTLVYKIINSELFKRNPPKLFILEVVERQLNMLPKVEGDCRVHNKIKDKSDGARRGGLRGGLRRPRDADGARARRGAARALHRPRRRHRARQPDRARMGEGAPALTDEPGRGHHVLRGARVAGRRLAPADRHRPADARRRERLGALDRHGVLPEHASRELLDRVPRRRDPGGRLVRRLQRRWRLRRPWVRRAPRPLRALTGAPERVRTPLEPRMAALERVGRNSSRRARARERVGRNSSRRARAREPVGRNSTRRMAALERVGRK